MKNFDKIIKEKVEGFEVPFNEAHWTEMEAKLNGIHSKKKKTLLFGSAAVIITLAISAYFLFPTNSPINSGAHNQVIEEELPINAEAAKGQSIITDNKTEVIKTKSTSLETKSTNLVTAVDSKETKSNVKAAKVITPTVIAEEKETTITEKKKEEQTSNSKERLHLTEVETTPIKKNTITTSAKESVNEPITKVTETPLISTESRKNVRHKAYEDENVSKKSIKRKRGNIFRFFSFKKRLYKVPLSKKKSSKRKK
jgi:hypothetical protein